MRQESPRDVIARVLEPGEQILWSGRPDVEVVLDQHSRRRRLSHVLGLAVIAMAVLWLPGYLGLPNPFSVLQSLAGEPRILLATSAPFVLVALAYVLKLDDMSRLKRYFDSQSYAITDRRLLIVEGDKVRSWTAERLGTPHIRERGPHRADVIFAESRTRSRERRKVGFKALPDAEDVKRRIEEWIDGELRRAAEEVAEFVESERSTTGSDKAPGARRVENQLLGLRIDFPTEWSVEVRHKKKPQGKFFFDNQDWRSLRDGDHWNVIKIEGPARCLIEVEVFETEPTITYDKLTHSRVADATAGKVVESDPDYELNGLRGFFVTRRNELQVDLDVNRVNVAAVVAPERLTVLHDGRRQVCVVSTWPEDSPHLKHAVDSVVESIAIY